MSSRKGGAFERELCPMLSLWWTEGKRDDVFWRSSGSGGRATRRHRKGKRTAGSYGDLVALDGVGAPLLQLVTIELKRGYSRCTLMDLLDRGDEEKPKGFEAFLMQAEASAEAAGTPHWLLIHKRDRKHCMIYFPWSLVRELRHRGCQLCSLVRADVELRCAGGGTVDRRIGGTLLREFLREVTPNDVRKVLSPF